MDVPNAPTVETLLAHEPFVRRVVRGVLLAVEAPRRGAWAIVVAAALVAVVSVAALRPSGNDAPTGDAAIPLEPERRSADLVEPPHEAAPDADDPGALATSPAEQERAPAGRAASWSAPLSGTLRGAEDGAPLAEFLIEITAGAGAIERVVTDRSGRFASARAYQAGDVRLSMLDCDGMIRDVRYLGRSALPKRPPTLVLPWEPESGSVDTRVPVGPTYWLVLAPPTGHTAGELVARLGEAASPAGYEYEAPLRDGGTWVRFPAPDSPGPFDPADPGDEGELRVETLDGLWAARAAVPVSARVHPTPVHLEFESRARLELEVVAGPGEPLVEVEVHVRHGSDLVGLGDGDFGLAFGGLESGPHSVSATARGCTTVRVDIELAVGETVRETVVLERMQHSSARLSGVVYSRSGTFKRPVTIDVRDANGRRCARQSVPWTSAGGMMVAPFEIEAVPAGQLFVALDTGLSRVPWEGPKEVDAPATDLVFTVLDDTDEAPRHLMLDIIDGATGESVEGFSYELAIAELPNERDSVGDRSKALFLDVPASAEVRWVVAAPGYAPEWGDETDFVAEGSVHVAVVRLRRGWGARVRFVDERGEALAGAIVLVDAEEVARTDALGGLLLRRRAAPERFALSIDGVEYELDIERVVGGARLETVFEVRR